MTPEEAAEKRQRIARRMRFLTILKALSEGKLDSKRTPLAKLFNQTQRKEYISPLDRSTTNYGYMTSSEMSAISPFEE